MSMIDQIGNEMIVASMVMHTNNVDRIAAVLMYSPVLIINALYAAEDAGKIKYNEKAKTFSIYEDVEPSTLSITEHFLGNEPEIDVKEEIVQLIRNLNKDEKDMSAEELSTWIPGSTAERFKIFAYVTPELAMYEIADPKDKQSVYTFLTLKGNEDKLWGKKQFDSKKSLAAKHARELEESKLSEAPKE